MIEQVGNACASAEAQALLMFLNFLQVIALAWIADRGRRVRRRITNGEGADHDG